MRQFKILIFHSSIQTHKLHSFPLKKYTDSAIVLRRLASVDTSSQYILLYSIHAGWIPLGSVYRVFLGLAAAMEGVLGIMIFLSRLRLKNK